VGDFHQIADPWSNHDMIFRSCCFEKLRVVQEYNTSYRDIDRSGLLGPAASLNWGAVSFMAGVNQKVDCFSAMLIFFLNTFVLVRRIKVTEGERLCSVCN
jgi:hypothetical protein